MVRTSRNVKSESEKEKEWGKRKESKKCDQKLALALLWSSSSSITQLVVLPWRFQNRVVKTDWNTYIGSLPNRRKEHR